MQRFAMAVVVVLVGVGQAAGAITVHRTFTVSPVVGNFLAWTGSSFYTTIGNDIISEYDLNGNQLSSFSSPGSPGHTLEQGLAFDGTHLWLYDRHLQESPSMFYKLDTAGNVVSSFVAPAGAENIYGLAWDGTNLLGTSYTDNRVLKIDTSGNLVETIGTQTLSSVGLGYDGTSLVVYDFDMPLGPLNQALVKIDPATGQATGVIPKEFHALPHYVFDYIGNDRWLMKYGNFTSGSTSGSHFYEVSLEWEDPPPFVDSIPEPSTILIWSLLGIIGIAYGWRRRKAA